MIQDPVNYNLKAVSGGAQLSYLRQRLGLRCETDYGSWGTGLKVSTGLFRPSQPFHNKLEGVCSIPWNWLLNGKGEGSITPSHMHSKKLAISKAPAAPLSQPANIPSSSEFICILTCNSKDLFVFYLFRNIWNHVVYKYMYVCVCIVMSGSCTK